MSFDAALRHVAGPRAAAPASSSAIAPAPAASSGPELGTILGLGAFVALVVHLVRSGREQGEQLRELGDVDSDRNVLEAHGETVSPPRELEQAPPALPAGVLALDRALRESHGWGARYVLPHNPPAWVLDEPTWEAAKTSVRPRWHQYAAPWAVVTHVYHAMGGRVAA